MSTNNNTPLTVLDVPAIQNDIIKDPPAITEQFRSATTSFDCYRILQEVFLHYVQSGGFDHAAEKKRKHYCTCMQIIGDAIFSLERYAQDWDAGTLIMKYMETVYRIDEDRMQDVVGSLKQLEDKYGSIHKGLDSLLEHKDSLARAEAVRRRNVHPSTSTDADNSK